jgi:hypothetical protein
MRSRQKITPGVDSGSASKATSRWYLQIFSHWWVGKQLIARNQQSHPGIQEFCHRRSLHPPAQMGKERGCSHLFTLPESAPGTYRHHNHQGRDQALD